MGFFDKMFGSGAATAVAMEPMADHRFNELKAKYDAVLDSLDAQHIQVENLHVQDNKLVIKGIAPNEGALNTVWDNIKAVDANWANEVTADLRISDTPTPETTPYTVKPGDSLWRIAKNELGHGTEYMKIFYANRDKLATPNSVFHPGDILQIPKA